MTASSKKKSSAARVREHRARKRAQGLKLVQFWVPDVNSEEFKREARRQGRLIANSPSEKDDQAFIDSITLKWWEDN